MLWIIRYASREMSYRGQTVISWNLAWQTGPLTTNHVRAYSRVWVVSLLIAFLRSTVCVCVWEREIAWCLYMYSTCVFIYVYGSITFQTHPGRVCMCVSVPLLRTMLNFLTVKKPDGTRACKYMNIIHYKCCWINLTH